jgi:hypothetical protein
MQCQCEGTSQLGSSIDGIDPARAGGKKNNAINAVIIICGGIRPRPHDISASCLPDLYFIVVCLISVELFTRECFIHGGIKSVPR